MSKVGSLQVRVVNDKCFFLGHEWLAKNLYFAWLFLQTQGFAAGVCVFNDYADTHTVQVFMAVQIKKNVFNFFLIQREAKNVSMST